MKKEESQQFSSNDALDTVGKILDKDHGRDAVHIAMMCAVAGEDLAPGSRVGIDPGTNTAKTGIRALGIVDPFLRQCVNKGSIFWFFLFPKSVTSLRHYWEHPQIPNDLKPSTGD